MIIKKLIFFLIFGLLVRSQAAPAVPAVQGIKSFFGGVPCLIKLYDVIPYFMRLKKYEHPAEKQRPDNTVFAFEKKDKSIKYTYSKEYAQIISQGIESDSMGLIADLSAVRAFKFESKRVHINKFHGSDGNNAYLVPRIFVALEENFQGFNRSRLNFCDQFSKLVDNYVLSYGFAETMAHKDKATGLFSEDSLHTQVSIMGSIEMTVNQTNFVSYGFFQYTFNEDGELYHRAFKPFSYKNLGMLSSGIGRQPIYDMLSELFLNNVLNKKSSYSKLEEALYKVLSDEDSLAEEPEYAEYSLGYQLRSFFNIG